MTKPKAKGRRIAILGDMLELGERSECLHLDLLEHVRGSADLVFTVGPMMGQLGRHLPPALLGGQGATADEITEMVVGSRSWRRHPRERLSRYGHGANCERYPHPRQSRSNDTAQSGFRRLGTRHASFPARPALRRIPDIQSVPVSYIPNRRSDYDRSADWLYSGSPAD